MPRGPSALLGQGLRTEGRRARIIMGPRSVMRKLRGMR